MSVYASSERHLPDPKRFDPDNNQCDVEGLEQNFPGHVALLALLVIFGRCFITSMELS